MEVRHGLDSVLAEQFSPVTHNASCDDANEDVTVQQIPSQIATGPFTYPQDSASIKSSVAGTTSRPEARSSSSCSERRVVTPPMRTA